VLFGDHVLDVEGNGIIIVLVQAGAGGSTHNDGLPAPG
jgi:hypothetical protein